MKTFFCYYCKQDLEKGYGIDRQDNKICYTCCANEDKKQLVNMKPGEKILLYFNGNEVTNWPGSLRIHASSYTIKHNFCRTAKMVYFHFDGRTFYGRKVGDQELTTFRVKK